MSLNALVRLPLSSSSRTHHDVVDGLVKHSLFSSRTTTWQQLQQSQRRQQRGGMLVIEGKGKKGMAARQFQRPPPPPLPKIEDDGNPRFVIFLRMANVFLSFSLSMFSFPLLVFFVLSVSFFFLYKFLNLLPFFQSSVKVPMFLCVCKLTT